ncbi:DUF7019 family protein [Streptomyces sp. CA-100214]
MAFRYFLYVSDSKIDMLLPQIDPGFAAKRTTKYGVNLQMVAAERTTESAQPDRFARLERVVCHLQDHGDLGSVDEPGQFFGGVLPVSSGALPNGGDASLVFFGGWNDHTAVGLGGSARHLLGSVPGVDASQAPSSLMPTILNQLGAGSELEDEEVVDAVGDGLARGHRAALATVHQAVRRLSRTSPAQNVEFVAKRLLHGTDPDGVTVLLGSPIYVALVD